MHLDGAGRPQFYSLLRRRSPQRFVAFDCDLLWLHGRDLRRLPLVERKRLLRGIMPPVGAVMYADYFEGCGVDLFRAICEQDLEGIVAKLAAEVYDPDATTWVKIKNRQYSQAAGRREFFETRRRALRT